MVLLTGCAEQVPEQTVTRLEAFAGSPLLQPPPSATRVERYLYTDCVNPDSPEAPVNGVRFDRGDAASAAEAVERYGRLAVDDGWGLVQRNRPSESGLPDESAYYQRHMGDWVAEFGVVTAPDGTTYLETKQREPLDYCSG